MRLDLLKWSSIPEKLSIHLRDETRCKQFISFAFLISETDFRLVLSDKPRDVDSPVASSCANLSLPIFPNVLRKTKVPKFYKRQLIRLRAPTIELKAVWQNLINRQV